MSEQLDAILKLEVPVIVQIAQRSMRLADVVGLVPGSIMELPKGSDDELELIINNMAIGTGAAVKVGENFGIRVAFIGDLRERLEALQGKPEPSEDVDDLSELADQFLAGS